MSSSPNYPLDWRQLRFPNKRAEMIEYLKEIANTNINPLPTYHEFDVDEIYHFFFDDTDLSDELRSSIGTILLNSEEQTAIYQLTRSLEQILKSVGDADSTSYLNHADWPRVRELARTALRTIGQMEASEG
jgi:hypothetical protein